MSFSLNRPRAPKITVPPPSGIPRLTPDDPRLAKESIPQLLEQYKPLFSTTLHLTALVLQGRQLGDLLNNKAVVSHFFNAVGYRHVQTHPEDEQRRIVVLNVPAAGAESLPAAVQEEVAKNSFEVVPHVVELGWDAHSSDAVLESMLPSSIVQTEGVPSGFTIVGHIAHLNLIDLYLPFRFLVGQVLLDKNRSSIRTVVNKLDSIDTQFRFFAMELLAGEPDYTARVSESECTFEFDFRTVYWNSRLHSEHERLVKGFRWGEVVADVMAGVGPFAVPAAKRGTWVRANDLNPKSYEALVHNARANHVLEATQDQDKRDNHAYDGGVLAFCMDGRQFIRQSILDTWNAPFRGRPQGFTSDQALREHARKLLKLQAKARRSGLPPPTEPQREKPSKLVDHFVMNLPASALQFLDAFRGAYLPLSGAELDAEMNSRGEDATPWVHVHCFSKDPLRPWLDILARANAALGIAGQPDELVCAPFLPPASRRLVDHPQFVSQAQMMQHLEDELDRKPTPGLKIHYVRDVAPNKQMYCLSFRVPRSVLFVQ